MNVRIMAVLSWLALGSTLAAQDSLGGRETEPVRARPRSLVDPQQVEKRRLPPELTTVPSDVRDTSGLFSAETLRSARNSLEKIEKSTGVPVLVETIETLRGETIDEAAMRHARRSGTQGIFILIARKESKIEVLASRRYSEALPRPARTKVRAAFIDPFRKSKFDEGLLQGLTALESELGRAKAEGKVPQAERVDGEPAGFDRPLQLRENAASGAVPAAGEDHESAGVRGQDKVLVIRNQVRLTLEGARTIIAGAAKQAESMNLKVNIAVVDDGGHLLSFDRMNGARPASGYTAITKATTAATVRQPSGPIPAGTASPDPLLNLSLQIAAQASGGKFTTLYGGIPVVVDGQVIGAVGVGGGSGEQDAQVARAGVQAFLDALDKQSPR